MENTNSIQHSNYGGNNIKYTDDRMNIFDYFTIQFIGNNKFMFLPEATVIVMHGFT